VVACFAAAVLWPANYVAAAKPHEGVQAAVKDLYRYLDTSGDGPNWRRYLRDSQLQKQLEQGEKADPGSVLAVLSRYGTGADDIQSPQLVKTRRALVDWLTALAPPGVEQLPAAARAAKAAFLPPTETDLEYSKADLLAALGRLDARLKSGGERGKGWAAYVKLDGVKEQLAREKPELKVLEAAYARMAAGHEGLNLTWFADVRRGLRAYVIASRLIGRADLRKEYETKLDELAKNLEAYGKSPSPETAAAINATVVWLDRAGQARWLVRGLRERLSHPNVHVEVSRGLIAARIAGPIDETRPVHDCILGTDIYGNAHAVGQTSVELVPAERTAELDILFKGRVDTNDAIGYHGPVQIHSNGTAQLEARKRLSLTPERVVGLPAAAQAEMTTTINAIVSNKGRAAVEKIGWKKATKQKPLAECIAARHAEQQFSERMDQQAAELIARTNSDLEKKLRRPLQQRNLFPEVFRFWTTAEALHVTLLEAADGSLAAPGAPPAVAERGDLVVRVHQTAINSFTNAALGGVIISAKRFRELANEHLGPLAQRKEGTKEDEDWSITFAPQPITVGFADGKFTVTIRGLEFYADGENHPNPMNVTAVYEIRKTEAGFKAIRQGNLSVLPPDFDPKSDEQIPPKLQVVRTMLERRFGKFLTEELTPKNLMVPVEGREPMELQLTDWETTRGWLALAFKRVAK
jgi:hypothetical protein